MARRLLSDGRTSGFGLVWGMLAVAATFSVITMAVFMCIGHKKPQKSEKKHRTDHVGATTAAVAGATAAATAAASSASTPTVC